MQKLPLRFSSNGIALPSKNKVIGEVEESTAKSKLPMKEKKNRNGKVFVRYFSVSITPIVTTIECMQQLFKKRTNLKGIN